VNDELVANFSLNCTLDTVHVHAVLDAVMYTYACSSFHCERIHYMLATLLPTHELQMGG